MEAFLKLTVMRSIVFVMNLVASNTQGRVVFVYPMVVHLKLAANQDIEDRPKLEACVYPMVVRSKLVANQDKQNRPKLEACVYSMVVVTSAYMTKFVVTAITVVLTDLDSVQTVLIVYSDRRIRKYKFQAIEFQQQNVFVELDDIIDMEPITREFRHRTNYATNTSQQVK